MMRTKLFVGVVAALAVTAFAAAPKVGLNKGENVSPFHPTHVSGPLANSTKCFPCTFQARPQIQAWINADDMKNVAAIAKTLDKAVADHKSKEFKAMVVFVVEPGKVDAKRKSLGEMAEGIGNNVSIAVLASNDEAVEAYKFSTKADVKNVIYAYKNWKVAETMVNFKADEKGIKTLNTAIAAL